MAYIKNNEKNPKDLMKEQENLTSEQHVVLKNLSNMMSTVDSDKLYESEKYRKDCYEKCDDIKIDLRENGLWNLANKVSYLGDRRWPHSAEWLELDKKEKEEWKESAKAAGEKDVRKFYDNDGKKASKAALKEWKDEISEAFYYFDANKKIQKNDNAKSELIDLTKVAEEKEKNKEQSQGMEL